MSGEVDRKQQPRILVIDDAALVRAWYRQVLLPAGCTVEEAINGIDGLEKMFLSQFDMAIVDVNMPKMDGLSFVRKLRASEGIAATPVVITSTLARDDDIAAGFTAGANLYVIKPVPEEALRQLVRIIAGAEP